jgi:hypothetical protein
LRHNKSQVTNAQVVSQSPFFLNETPNRIDLFRMRSGVRFMMRATSSSGFADLASSTTRRSSANDHDLRFFNDAPFM